MKECKSTPPARELVAVAEPHEYDRLVLATSMIARHPDYPGKQEVVSLCRQEIDERFAFQLLMGRDREVNAFALPGGYMGVYAGLIAIGTAMAEFNPGSLFAGRRCAQCS